MASHDIVDHDLYMDVRPDDCPGHIYLIKRMVGSKEDGYQVVCRCERCFLMRRSSIDECEEHEELYLKAIGMWPLISGVE